MSIRTIDINQYPQFFNVSLQNKHKYGEINTDFKLANQILQLIPNDKFKNPKLKWLDPCCGRGYFSIALYKKLFNNLPIKNEEKHNHIINEMLWMIEINSEHITVLKEIFGEKAHIINADFLTTVGTYDMIFGNPPFNVAGQVKVPTNIKISKKSDGASIWQQFIKHSIHCLKDNGHLTFITPSIWMKRDHSMYQYMLQYNIKKIHTMTNTETNKAFHGHAQTPTCYFTLNIKSHKCPFYKPISIYDKSISKYVTFNPRIGDTSISLPLFAQSVLQRLCFLVEKYGHIKVIKTSMRPDYKGLSVTSQPDNEHTFPNISTCVLNGLQPELVINYSNKQCVHADQPKLVLAHKMYGFPYYDSSGTYGISNRDNYVILNKTPEQFKQLKSFFSTKFALYLFEATRYRMKYLEKYIFEMIPDITKIPNFSTNDAALEKYFRLLPSEIEGIQNHSKDYKQF
jgi:tRNA1(Val) A37 N6-methylase TrmN6